jgi:SAM-dependent methyltransferase
LITALDVLEHIDNDLAAMQELYRICKPGGRLLVTVPAYGFLWSEHDEALHHRRRYAAYELRNKLTLAGFQIERCSYFIMLLFLPILIIRVIQGIFKHSTSPRTSHIQLPKIINQTLIWLLAIEKWLVRYINLPLGVSIVCLAQKPLGAEVTSSRTNVISLPAFRERVAPRH